MAESFAHSTIREEVEKLCCPLCGSQFFVSSKNRGGHVFHVGDTPARDINVVKESNDEHEIINLEKIFCGACSWRGQVLQLV